MREDEKRGRGEGRREPGRVGDDELAQLLTKGDNSNASAERKRKIVRGETPRPYN